MRLADRGIDEHVLEVRLHRQRLKRPPIPPPASSAGTGNERFANSRTPAANRARAPRCAPATEWHRRTAGCLTPSGLGRLSCPEQGIRYAPTARPSGSFFSRPPPFSILNQELAPIGIPQMKTPPRPHGELIGVATGIPWPAQAEGIARASRVQH
jgi:hypothetical protein